MTVHMPTEGASEAKTMAAVLAEAAGRHFGASAIIENLSRESGGASRQTWSFDAEVAGKRHGLILRRDPPLQDKSGSERSSSLDRATEFRVLLAAHRAGVRAPEPLFELSAGDGLGEAYVMRRIEGTAIARKLLRDPPYEEARRRIAGQLGKILVRIHATDPATLPPLATRQAGDQIALLRRSLDGLASPQPVFELALSWLDRRKPAPTPKPVLVHGDYLSCRRIGGDRDPRLGGRPSRRPGGGSRLGVREELALRRGRQARRRLRHAPGTVDGV
jgi:aminoglycoside phosphotransferase (APT) family kinase protein